MRTLRRAALVLLVAGPLIISAACGDDDSDVDAPEDAGTQISGAASGTPQAGGSEHQADVVITSPNDGATVSAGDVTVSINASNFEIIDKFGDPPVPGQGMVHYYRDVDKVPTTPGEPALTPVGTYYADAITSYTWEDVEPGEHVFAVQLVNNDQTPLEPPVVEQVTVTIE